MHISYEQIPAVKMVEDEEVKKMLLRTSDKKAAVELLINNMKKTIEDFKEEQKVINNIAARFGSFLKHNAIMTYNDSIKV